MIVSWVSNAQITITRDASGFCPGRSVKLSFINNVPNIVVYKWEILRNTSAVWSQLDDSTSASISTREAGDYRLKIKDNVGTITPSNILNIIKFSAPDKPIIATENNRKQVCQGGLDSVKISTQIQTGALFYNWSVDNKTSSIANNTQIYVKKNGFYKVTVGDGVCFTVSDSVQIDYKNSTEVKIDSVPPVCSLSQTPFNLKASPIGGRFMGKGITDANLGTFSPSVAGLGKHLITYTVLTSGGSCGDLKETRTITVATPDATITTNTGRTQFCVGDIAILSAPAGMKNYEWFLNASSVGTARQLTVGAAGNFKLKVTDNEPCENTSPVVRIDFISPSTIKIDPIASGCGVEFPAVPLTATPSGGAFTINGDFATTFDYKKLGFGKHTIAYVINGALPCLKGSDTQVVEIQDFPKPNLGTDILLGKGNGIVLKGFIDPTMTYLWTPAVGLDNPILANPLASPILTTEYSLTIKTTLGCPGTGKVNIVVYQPIYIPTAFSPNADSMNDLWELEGMQAYPNAEVQIFNRWGNVVYYSKGAYYLAPFDGNSQSKQLPEGIYVYKINPFPDRLDFQYKGTFMLLR